MALVGRRHARCPKIKMSLSEFLDGQFLPIADIFPCKTLVSTQLPLLMGGNHLVQIALGTARMEKLLAKDVALGSRTGLIRATSSFSLLTSITSVFSGLRRSRLVLIQLPAVAGHGQKQGGLLRSSIFVSIVYGLFLLSSCVFLLQPARMHSEQPRRAELHAVLSRARTVQCYLKTPGAGFYLKRKQPPQLIPRGLESPAPCLEMPVPLGLNWRRI